MKKRRVKKSVIMFVLRIVSISIIVCFFVTSFSYIFKLKNLSDQNKELNNSFIQLKEDGEKQEDIISKLNDKEYIARYARQHYLYTSDGEFALRIDKEKTNDVVTSNSFDYKYIYIGFIGCFIVLCFVFIRHKLKKK